METKTLLITLLDGPENLLHAIPALRAIRTKYQQANITLLADRSCEELSDFLPSGITMRTLQNISDPLEENERSPELLIQLGQSKESLALTTRIHATKYIGARMENDQVLLPEKWDRYAELVRDDTQYNPFHKVDLLRNAAEQIYEEENFELNVPENLHTAIQKHIQGDAHIKVAVSLEGQDAEELCATVTSILSLGLHLRIYLLGTVKDRRLSAEISSRLSGITGVVDLCGRLSLRESAAFTHTSDILICTPGRYSALAAGFGTFCICLDASRGAEFYRYPYGHGHLILQRNRELISADNFGESIASIVHFTIMGKAGNIPNQGDWQGYFDSSVQSLLGKMRVFITQRVQYSLEEGVSRTDLQLHPLIYTGAEFSDCIRSFYHLLWENSLNGVSIAATNLEILQEESLSLLNKLLAPLEQLYELASFGQKYILIVKKHIKNQEVEKAKVESAHLQEVDDLIQMLASTHPALSPICQYFSLTQSQCRSTEIYDVASELAVAYRNLQQHVLILLDLQKSLYQTTYEKEKLLQPSLEEGGSLG